MFGTDGRLWEKGRELADDPLGIPTGLVSRGVPDNFYVDADNNNVLAILMSDEIASDPETWTLIAPEYAVGPETRIFAVVLGQQGSIRLELDQGLAPPYERADLIPELENGNLFLCLRIKGETEWIFSRKGTDSADPYDWTDTRASWLAALQRIIAANGVAEVVLMAADRRDPTDPVLNTWHTVPLAYQQKQFLDEILPHMFMVIDRRGIGGTPLAQYPIPLEGQPPYDWEWFELPLYNHSETEAFTVPAIYLIDGTKRCKGDLFSPWLPEQFSAGEDGQGFEWIYYTTEADIVPVLPNNANDWAYDRPEGGWTDAIPDDFSVNKPFVWGSVRVIPDRLRPEIPRIQRGAIGKHPKYSRGGGRTASPDCPA